jgi:flagellar hook-basal body complex protein FliE
VSSTIKEEPMSLFTVVAGFVEGTRHVIRRGDLTRADVSIQMADVSWSESRATWSRHIVVELVGEPLEEAIAIWGAPDAFRSKTPVKALKSITVAVNLRGSSKAETRAAKKAAGLEEILDRWEKEVRGLERNAIRDIQDSFDQLIVEANNEYSDAQYKVMTTNAELWTGLDKDAGSDVLIEERKAAIAKVKELDKAIRSKRCAEMLRSMEEDKWILQSEGEAFALQPELVARVKEAYLQGLAFSGSGRMLV